VYVFTVKQEKVK